MSFQFVFKMVCALVMHLCCDISFYKTNPSTGLKCEHFKNSSQESILKIYSCLCLWIQCGQMDQPGQCGRACTSARKMFWRRRQTIGYCPRPHVLTHLQNKLGVLLCLACVLLLSFTNRLWRRGSLTELLLPRFLLFFSCIEFFWEFFLVFLEGLGWLGSFMGVCEALCDMLVCKKGYTNKC